MNGLALVAVGLWMMGVAWHGNTDAALADTTQQKAFLPWLVAVVILYALAQVDTLRGPVKAISVLAAIAVILKQWPNIEKSFSELTRGTK